MKSRYSFLLVTLSALFCVSLIISNIIAGKLWAAPFGITLTAGVFLFPLVYIIGDVIPECYGLQTARKLIYLGFAMNLVAVFFFMLTLRAAHPVFWEGQGAFETVLGFTPRLLLASFVAYLIGTNVNAWVLVRIKKLTGTKLLWLRTITSTLFGEGVDSTIFILIAFWGIIPTPVLPGMILAQAGFKTLYEILATPFTYMVVNWVKRMEGIEKEPSVQPVPINI